jgi:hypothetical protein
MMMEKKDADASMNVNNMKNVVDLEQKGLKVNWGPGMLWALLPSNGKDSKSPYANKKVREALEYAVDRPTIAKTIGFGKFEPLTQIVPSASPAFNRGYNPRLCNPEKAKQLLAEAGYPNGFDTKLLALEFNRDQAVAVRSYLTAVGIRVTVDLADMGRYFGALFGPGGLDQPGNCSLRHQPGRDRPLRPFRSTAHDLPMGLHRKVARIPRPCGQGVEDVRTGGLEQSAATGGEAGGRRCHGYPPLESRPGERDAALVAHGFPKDPQHRLVPPSGLLGEAQVRQK